MKPHTLKNCQIHLQNAKFSNKIQYRPDLIHYLGNTATYHCYAPKKNHENVPTTCLKLDRQEGGK